MGSSKPGVTDQPLHRPPVPEYAAIWINEWHVTALPPEGCRFSSHSGLTRAQPGPGIDVSGAVDIGVVRPAARADHGILSRSRAPGAAAVAVDARVGGVHQDHAPSSLFRFGSKDADELTPACIKDRLVQPRLRRCAIRQILGWPNRVRAWRGAAGHRGRGYVL